jgi:hypothetical protein
MGSKQPGLVFLLIRLAMSVLPSAVEKREQKNRGS